MMIKPIYAIALSAVCMLLHAGCTEQRDLYTVSRPMLCINGDWVPSLDRSDMTMNATANLYAADGGELFSKSYFSLPTSVTIPCTRGEYDLLLFNGMMYSEENTHLDNVTFRNTGRLETFEAVASEGTPNVRLSRAEGEFIASNDMELLTSMQCRVEVEGETGYFIKYKNGENGYPTHADYVESSVDLTPAPVSYVCQVIVNLVNPASAAVANGALKGFAGSVYMSDRMPSHIAATHHLRLNSLYLDPTPKNSLSALNPDGDPTGSIRSVEFVTFGPPLDGPSGWGYAFEISIIQIDGEIHEERIDIGDQVGAAIAQIRKNVGVSVPAVTGYKIVIEVDVALPKLEPVDGIIGVDLWEDDEIIKVPVKWN